VAVRSLIPDLSLLLVNLDQSMVVSSIEREGVPLEFTHENQLVHIVLDRIFGVDEEFTVRIKYGGYPGNMGWEFGEYEFQGAYTFSEPWYAHYWRPCKESPSDKVTADVWVTVPATMIAASNGLLVEVIDQGHLERTYHWRSGYPIANYLISAAMTNYSTFSDQFVTAAGDTVPIDYFVYPQDLGLAQESFAIVPEMMGYLGSVFGDYPFADEKYGMAEVGSGTMEHQTLTSITHNAMATERTVLHELAHQWWGDCVTCATWHDIWLNEGFASYGEALWYGYTDPPNGYLARMEEMDTWWNWEGSVYRYDLSYDLFDWVVYHKGAWVLHMLRHVIGEEDFWAAFDAYRAAFEYGAATTEDLETVFKTVTATSLDWFFDEWVYGQGRPDYDYWWLADVPEPGNVTLHVEQVQTDAPPFKMPIDIDVMTGSGAQRFTVWDSLQTQEFVLEGVESATGLVFDPDNWLLDWHEEITVGVADAAGGLTSPVWTAVWPQPARNRVNLAFRLPEMGARGASPIELAIFDVVGRRVWARVEPRAAAGEHVWSWDGLDRHGVRAPDGVYYARLSSGVGRNREARAGDRATARIVLLR
jgi:hypothetical protein